MRAGGIDQPTLAMKSTFTPNVLADDTSLREGSISVTSATIATTATSMLSFGGIAWAVAKVSSAAPKCSGCFLPRNALICTISPFACNLVQVLDTASIQ